MCGGWVEKSLNGGNGVRTCNVLRSVTQTLIWGNEQFNLITYFGGTDHQCADTLIWSGAVTLNESSDCHCPHFLQCLQWHLSILGHPEGLNARVVVSLVQLGQQLQTQHLPQIFKLMHIWYITWFSGLKNGVDNANKTTNPINIFTALNMVMVI